MLSSSPVMAFVATTDAARAKAFYRDVLGLTFVADDSFALVFDAHGTMLRVSRVQELASAPYTVLGWKVTDIGATMRELGEHGIAFERYPGLGQSEEGVCTFQDGTKVAWFKDPDGNTLSVTQFSA